MWEGCAERAGTAGALPLPAGGEPPGRARGALPPPPRRPPPAARRTAGWAGAGAVAGGRQREGGEGPRCSAAAWPAGREEAMNIQRGRGKGGG